MDQIKFDQLLSTENKAIKYAASLNFIFVLMMILVIIINPEAKWMILLILAAVSILLVIGLGAFLYRRYEQNIQVQQKNQVLKQNQEETEKLAQIETRIEDIARRHTEILNNEVNQLKIKQSNHDNFIRYLDNRLQISDAELRRQLSIALSDLQDQFIKLGMESNTIESANIPWLDAKFIDRLSSHGINTANDVSQEKLSGIRGLGEAEVESLLHWRAEIENDLHNIKPSELPPEQKAKIESRNQEKVKEIESQIAHLNNTLDVDLEEIRVRACQEREQNEKDETEAITQRESAFISFELSQEQLNSYQDITPINFLKASMSLDEGLPKASHQWVAAGAGLFLVLSCLFVGVYGLKSSSQVAVAMLVTDTPTITLTPTPSNTPTVTQTPTPSPTETTTLTYTPTDTLTPSNTPTPSATLTLAISLTPSDTPVPSVTLPQQDIMGCIPADNERVVGVVTRIIDGDTIIVTFDGADHVVRYTGIDAPEQDAPYGEYATTENTKLVLWETVTLVKDTTDMDGDEYLLRYVIAGDRFINIELLKLGAASVNLVEPDVACAVAFESAQIEAQQADLGLWILTPSP